MTFFHEETMADSTLLGLYKSAHLHSAPVSNLSIVKNVFSMVLLTYLIINAEYRTINEFDNDMLLILSDIHVTTRSITYIEHTEWPDK